MRLRQENLKTGQLLTCFADTSGSQNASLLFLVSGARDIEPLRRLGDALRPKLDASSQWVAVANALDLVRVDPRLNPHKVTRLEVAEFDGLTPEAIRQVLDPGLRQMRQGEAARFPSATRMEGSVARGPDFLERPEDIAELRLRLEHGHHTLVLAPRRSGKTTLLVKLSDSLGDAFHVELVDAQPHRTPESFTADLRARVTGKPFTAALREVRERGWESSLPEALRELAKEPQRPLVLMLDELVFFLEHLGKPEPVRRFLNALDAAVKQVKALLLIAGSVDLRPFVRKLLKGEPPGLFGALTPFRLPPLASRSLEVQLRQVMLGTGLVAEAGDMAWMKENVDLGMPYPALRFLSHVASVLRTRPLPQEGLEAELASYLRDTSAFSELESHLNRLAEEKPQQAERVEEVLDVLARTGRRELSDVKAALGGAKSQEMLDWLMTHFPLEQEGKELTLASCLFRRYWQERGR